MCQVFQDVEDDHALTYLVEWETEGEMEDHLRSERFRRLLPYIEMSVEPPQVSFRTITEVRGIDFLVAALSQRLSERE